MPEFAAEVRDLLLRPPVDNPYTLLREQLTKCTTASEQHKLQQLFTGEELGDRKPSTGCSSCWEITRPGLTDTSFLQELFLQRLHHSVRMVLASTPNTTTLDKLAAMADKIMEVTAPPPPPSCRCYHTYGSGPMCPHWPWQLRWSTSVQRSLAWRSFSRSSLTLDRPLTLPSTPRVAPRPPPQRIHSAGTVIRARGVALPVPGHQMGRPVTSGDKCQPTPPRSPLFLASPHPPGSHTPNRTQTTLSSACWLRSRP